jgi:hypothetical protein
MGGAFQQASKKHFAGMVAASDLLNQIASHESHLATRETPDRNDHGSRLCLQQGAPPASRPAPNASGQVYKIATSCTESELMWRSSPLQRLPNAACRALQQRLACS